MASAAVLLLQALQTTARQSPAARAYAASPYPLSLPASDIVTYLAQHITSEVDHSSKSSYGRPCTVQPQHGHFLASSTSRRLLCTGLSCSDLATGLPTQNPLLPAQLQRTCPHTSPVAARSGLHCIPASQRRYSVQPESMEEQPNSPESVADQENEAMAVQSSSSLYLSRIKATQSLAELLLELQRDSQHLDLRAVEVSLQHATSLIMAARKARRIDKDSEVMSLQFLADRFIAILVEKNRTPHWQLEELSSTIVVLHNFAALGHNPAGDLAGLQALCVFLNRQVLQSLIANKTALPDYSARLVDLLFSVAKLLKREMTGHSEDESQDGATDENTASTDALPSPVEGWGPLPPLRQEVTVPPDVLPLVTGITYELSGSLSHLKARYLSKLVQALAMLKHVDYQLIDKVCQATRLKLQDFDNIALENIMTHLDRLEYSWDTRLLDQVANRVLANLSQKHSGMNMRQVVGFVAAFANLRYENMELYQRAATHARMKMNECRMPEISKLARAMAIRGLRDRELYRALAHRACNLLPTARPINVAITMYGFSKQGYIDVATEMQLTDRVAERMVSDVEFLKRFSMQNLGNIMLAFTQLNLISSEAEPSSTALMLYQMVAARVAAGLRAGAQWQVHYVEQNLTDLALAYGLANLFHLELFDALADRIVERISTLSKTSIVDATRAFALVAGAPPDPDTGLPGDSASQRYPKLFAEMEKASRYVLVEFGPEYLALMLDSFRLARHPLPKDYLQVAVDAAMMKWQRFSDPQHWQHLDLLADALRNYQVEEQLPHHGFMATVAEFQRSRVGEQAAYSFG